MTNKECKAGGFLVAQKIRILEHLNVCGYEISDIIKSIILKHIDGAENENITAYLEYEEFYKRLCSDNFDKAEILRHGNHVKKGKSILNGSGEDRRSHGWGSGRPWRPRVGSYYSTVNGCKSLPVPVYGCIYFLLKKTKIIYIGQTESPAHRIIGHNKKDYDYAAIIPCLIPNRKDLEIKLIKYFRPKLNKQHNPDWVNPNKKTA